MPTVHHRSRNEQLDLFQPPLTRPLWRNLPPEVRDRVLELLTQLLRELHESPGAPRVAVAARRKEVRDE